MCGRPTWACRTSLVRRRQTSGSSHNSHRGICLSGASPTCGRPIARGPTGQAPRVWVARLGPDESVANYEIAERVGVTRPTVNLWRNRYAERGLPGLEGVRPPGRPRSVDRAKVITATLTPPPASLGVTHWSSRLLADRLGIEHSTVATIWKEYGVKPWKAGEVQVLHRPGAGGQGDRRGRAVFRRRRTPSFFVSMRKPQVQALNRTQKTLPIQPGHAEPSDGERGTHDYVCHGTTTLFAALEIATGTVIGLCKDRHGHREFLGFLKHVARTYTGRELHLVMDNYATHKRVEVPRLAGGEPARYRALHPDVRVVAQPGRGVVRDHRTPGHPPRQLHLGPRPDDQDPAVHHRMEPAQAPVHLDRTSRPDPRQDQP